MSTAITMPVISTPGVTPPDAIPGRVLRWHRMPGRYVGAGEPVVDLEVDTHQLTLCAPFAGKIMRGTELGTVVKAGDMVTELTGVGKPTWELFVAYRRKDAPGHAGRVGERLIRHFGSGQVFKDIESLPPGVNFPEFIREKLKRAFVMVVIIGPNWASNPRLQDPSDLHREEIATAFKRRIRVFPVGGRRNNARKGRVAGGDSRTRRPSGRGDH